MGYQSVTRLHPAHGQLPGILREGPVRYGIYGTHVGTVRAPFATDPSVSFLHLPPSSAVSIIADSSLPHITIITIFTTTKVCYL